MPDSTRSQLLRGYAPIAIVIALLALVPLWSGDSRSMMTVVTTGLAFGAYAVAFNLIFGSTGQLFLCVGALAGIGGFGSAILSERTAIPFVVTMLLAMVLAAGFGALLSWVAVSRSLDTIFTGIVTLAFSLSFENFVLGRQDLTGGENGLRVEAGSDTVLGGQISPYYVFLAMLAAYLVLFRIIQTSHFGWAFRALRDDEVAAELSGIDVARYRIYAAAVGSAMLGLTGATFAHYRSFIGDSTYAFGNVDVRVLVMLAFGGIGTVLGPVIGATVFTVVDELLVDYASLREVIYGVVTLVLFLSFRQGAVPAFTGAVGRLLGGGRTLGSAAVEDGSGGAPEPPDGGGPGGSPADEVATEETAESR
ncbi:MAG: branched-chain amino acid ABC transporter permease [Actinomycetota bacterium]